MRRSGRKMVSGKGIGGGMRWLVGGIEFKEVCLVWRRWIGHGRSYPRVCLTGEISDPDRLVGFQVHRSCTLLHFSFPVTKNQPLHISFLTSACCSMRFFPTLPSFLYTYTYPFLFCPRTKTLKPENSTLPRFHSPHHTVPLDVFHSFCKYTSSKSKLYPTYSSSNPRARNFCFLSPFQCACLHD